MTFSVLTIIDSLVFGMELVINLDFFVTELEDFFELKNQCKKIIIEINVLKIKFKFYLEGSGE